MTAAANFPLCCPPLVLGLADPDESVAAGREVLDRWIWCYPWYDSATDGVKRIDAYEPWYLRWDWFWDWLEDLFGSGWRGLGSLSWFEWIAWGVIAVVSIVVVYLMVRAFRMRQHGRLRFAVGSKRSDAADDRRRVEALPSAIAYKRSDLLAEARRHYRQGNYGEAIVYLFSFQLVQLDKNQLIRLTKGKTNRQYLRELGRRTLLRRQLERTMVAFEDFFFGNHSIDRPRFESIWSRLDDFEALVAEGAA